jgi:hypothetical protein
MKLPIPPEPVNLKREAVEKFYEFKMHHKLPSYLWNKGQWSGIFMKEGCGWPCFLHFYGWLKVDDWISGDISWDELINEFINLTEQSYFRETIHKYSRTNNQG